MACGQHVWPLARQYYALSHAQAANEKTWVYTQVTSRCRFRA